MVVISIDISYSSTGICVMGINGSILIILETFLIKNDKKNEDIAEFLIRFEKNLISLFKKYDDIEKVVLEDLTHSSSFTTAKQIFLVHGVALKVIVQKLGLKYKYYPNATWRSILKIKNGDYKYENTIVIDKKTKKEKKKKKKVFKKVDLCGEIVNKDVKYNTIVKINEDFNLKLKYKDNDIADAIAIANAHLQQK